MKFRHLAAITSVSFLSTASINAWSDWYVNPGFGYFNFDRDLHLEDMNFPIVGLEYQFPSGWAIEGAYLIGKADSEVIDSEFDYNQVRVDALKYFQYREDITPYLAVGVGNAEFESTVFSTSETVTNAGVGLRYALTDALTLRGDARAFYGSDESDLDYAFTFTLAFRFGGANEPVKKEPVVEKPVEPPPPVAEPIAEPVEPTVVVSDNDGDGVADENDKCNDTAPDVKVNEVGCPLLKTETVAMKLDVKFPVNQYQLPPQSYNQLQELATFMDRYSQTTAVIEGHSDSLGDAGYNKTLSQRRADNIRNILIQSFGISPDRLQAIGYGEEKPIADNATKEGREANRRVVANISTQVKKVEKK